jgi:hypothetical protein
LKRFGPGISRSAIFVGAVSLSVFAAHTALFYGYLVDDAYITYRFADNLVAGHGIVWNRGEESVEGYTNFSWLLLSALMRLLGFRPDSAMLVIGLCAGLGTVAVSVVATRRFDAKGEDALVARGSGLASGLVAATFSGLALYATTGLETALYGLLSVCAAVAFVERRAIAFGVLVGLAFLTRPEAALLGLVGLVFFALDPSRRESRGRDLALAASAMAALVVPYLVVKLVTFGALFPNTLAAKQPSIDRGLSYLLDDGWPAGVLVVATYIGARVEKRREARELGVLSAAFAVAVVFEGGDWMPAGRMLLPVVLWLAIASDTTVRRWGRLASPRLVSAGGLALFMAWFAANAITTEGLVATAPDIGRMNDARRALFARFDTEGVRRMALVDIGLPGYLLPDVAITDLGGLVDREIGEAPGGHLAKHPDTAYLASRADDIYLLTTFGAEGEAPPSPEHFKFEVERYIAATEWFRAHYRLRERIDGFRESRTYVYARVADEGL